MPRNREQRRHPQIAGCETVMNNPGFVGTIEIGDLERNKRYVKYAGRYHCIVCDQKGVQITSYWADKWPKGVSDEHVEADMKLCVQKNHVHRGWGKA